MHKFLKYHEVRYLTFQNSSNHNAHFCVKGLSLKCFMYDWCLPQLCRTRQTMSVTDLLELKLIKYWFKLKHEWESSALILKSIGLHLNFSFVAKDSPPPQMFALFWTLFSISIYILKIQQTCSKYFIFSYNQNTIGFFYHWYV